MLKLKKTFLLYGAGLIFLLGCKNRLPFEKVQSIETLPPPTCEKTEAKLIATQYFKSGPTMRDQNIYEKFELTHHGCYLSMNVHQRWPLNNSDVEIFFDSNGKPLRIKKHMFYTKPNKPNEVITDERLYELRAEKVTLSIRNPRGEKEYRVLKGEKPIAVVGPGRGLLSIWIRASKLKVGEITRGPVLDFRDKYESIKQVALKREPDRIDPKLGGRVQVYTVFGRETVFTNDQGIVIGDLSGLRTDPSPDPKMFVSSPSIEGVRK